MRDPTVQNVGHRLDPTVRVHGEPGNIVLGIIRAKVVKQQERVYIVQLGQGDTPLKLDAGPFQYRARLDEALHLPDPRFNPVALLVYAHSSISFITVMLNLLTGLLYHGSAVMSTTCQQALDNSSPT